MTDDLSPKPDHYFPSSTPLMRFLRFLNLLEPGRAVISVSKLMMWFSAFLLVWTLIYTPTNIIAVLGALGTFFGTLGNYIYRAWRDARGKE